MCEICSKLTITKKQGQWSPSCIFTVNFEQILRIVLVFPLLTLNKKLLILQLLFLFAFLLLLQHSLAFALLLSRYQSTVADWLV